MLISCINQQLNGSGFKIARVGSAPVFTADVGNIVGADDDGRGSVQAAIVECCGCNNPIIALFFGGCTDKACSHHSGLYQFVDAVSFAGDVANTLGMGAVAMGTELNNLAVGAAAGGHATHKIAHAYGFYVGSRNMECQGIVAIGSETLAEVGAVGEVGGVTVSVNAAMQKHVAKVRKVLGYSSPPG